MSTVSIRTPADLAAAVPALLGFTPEDSLVIVGSPGPVVRVDLAGRPDLAVEACAEAARHWTVVAVVVYSDDDTALTEVIAAIWRVMPDVSVKAALRVHDGIVFDALGHNTAVSGTAPGALGANAIMANRDALAADAALTTDPDEAHTMAWASYRAGNGARAWCFLDRYTALSGLTDTNLKRRLNDAVPPTED